MAALDCPLLSGLDARSPDESNNNACVMTSTERPPNTEWSFAGGNTAVQGCGLWHVPNPLAISGYDCGIETSKVNEVTRERCGTFDGASMH